MKVKKEGMKASEWKADVTCTTCCAELEVTVDDVTKKWFIFSYVAAYKCPECGSVNYINQVPAIIMRSIRESEVEPVVD